VIVKQKMYKRSTNDYSGRLLSHQSRTKNTWEERQHVCVENWCLMLFALRLYVLMISEYLYALMLSEHLYALMLSEHLYALMLSEYLYALRPYILMLSCA
jgi:hypothetical protein